MHVYASNKKSPKVQDTKPYRIQGNLRKKPNIWKLNNILLNNFRVKKEKRKRKERKEGRKEKSQGNNFKYYQVNKNKMHYSKIYELKLMQSLQEKMTLNTNNRSLK